MTSVQRAEAAPVPAGLPCVRQVSVKVDDGRVDVVVRGRLVDDGLTAFHAELLDLCDVCVGDLTVDLTACDEITAELVTVLVAADVRARLGQCRLRLVNVGPGVLAEDLEMLGDRTRAEGG